MVTRTAMPTTPTLPTAASSIPQEFLRVRLGRASHSQNDTKYPWESLRVLTTTQGVRKVTGGFEAAVTSASALSSQKPIGNEYGSSAAVAILRANDDSLWIAPLKKGFIPQRSLNYHSGDREYWFRSSSKLLAVVGSNGEFADLRAKRYVQRTAT